MTTPTLRAFLHAYIHHVHRPATTVEGYRRSADVLIEIVGDIPIDTITIATLERFMAAKRETPTQANRSLQLLNAAWKRANNRQEIDAPNLVPGIKLNRERPRRRHLDGDDLRKLLAIVQAELVRQKFVQTTAAVALLIYTWTRIGEMLSARWSSVDWKRKSLRVVGKTGPRDVALSDKAIEILTNLDAMRPRFGGKVEDSAVLPVSRGGVEKRLRTLCKRAGVQEISPHDCRRSAAILAREMGTVPLLAISAQLGHEQVSTTLRHYSLPTAKGAALAADAVSEVL